MIGKAKLRMRGPSTQGRRQQALILNCAGVRLDHMKRIVPTRGDLVRIPTFVTLWHAGWIFVEALHARRARSMERCRHNSGIKAAREAMCDDGLSKRVGVPDPRRSDRLDRGAQFRDAAFETEIRPARTWSPNHVLADRVAGERNPATGKQFIGALKRSPTRDQPGLSQKRRESRVVGAYRRRHCDDVFNVRAKRGDVRVEVEPVESAGAARVANDMQKITAMVVEDGQIATPIALNKTLAAAFSKSPRL